MVSVKVRIYEVLGSSAKKDLDIDLGTEEATVSSLLQKLSQLFGQGFSTMS